MTARRCTVVTGGADNWFTPFVERLVERLGRTADATLLFSHDEVTRSDIVFYLGYHSVVPLATLALSGNNVVVHGSDLPHGRGWSPLSWQILEGRDEITLTLFEATESVDAGPIYFKETVEFDGTELVEELRAIIGERTISLCEKFVEQLPDISSNGQNQVGSPTYYRRRTADDSRIDPTISIAEQFNLFRIVDNDRYPAFFEWRDRRYYLRIESSDV
jgi:methionyl-tRNA formyltransferase|tara:strand:- start:59 stop:712 length:654 start_codon:yes stop_codon:yes gene_type:complete